MGGIELNVGRKHVAAGVIQVEKAHVAQAEQLASRGLRQVLAFEDGEARPLQVGATQAAVVGGSKVGGAGLEEGCGAPAGIHLRGKRDNAGGVVSGVGLRHAGPEEGIDH